MDEQHLHSSILKAISDSDKAGGVYLKDLKPGSILEVKTRNTTYEIRHDPDQEGQWMIHGHPKYCPDWTKASIAGSTFGGSMLKMKYVGVGMYLEFTLSEADLGHATVTTSQILEVWVK